MAVKLTYEQMKVVDDMAKIMGNFADQLYHIIENHGLDQVKDFMVRLEVNPALDYMTRRIDIGISVNSDAGYVTLAKGKDEAKYVPTGRNSPEYEYLFADPAVKDRMREIVSGKKPLPPDGLWIGNPNNDPVLDCRGREVRFDDLAPGKIGGVNEG